jgi:amino acid permease
MRLRVHAAIVALCIAAATPISGFNKPLPAKRPVNRRQQPHTYIPKLDKKRNPTKLSEQANPNGGTATIPNEIFNLVKCIVGAGVLSLPAGIAAFGNAPSALIPSTILIAVMGAISAYTFSMIARVCNLTGATSYSDAWDRTRGKRTAWIVAASSALDCFAGNLCYSMVLADTFKDLLAAIGITATRSNALLALTSLVLLPLCLVKNLSSLAPFSLVGIMGMAYTSIAIGIRYFGGAYASPGGRFLSDLAPHMQPSFGSTGAVGALSPKSLILITLLSTAYIAHFNAPKFYRELKNNTMQRFNTVVTSSFGISVAVYAAVSAMGFLTFGSATAGLILSNYSTQDVLLSFSRFAVAISLVFSYPLLFVGTREGLLDLIRVPEEKRTNSLLNKLSIGLLGIITWLALHVTDLTFVASMSGAVLGTSLIFIFPTLMFRAAVKDSPTKGHKWESRLCSLIATLGVAIGIVGAKMALQSI